MCLLWHVHSIRRKKLRLGLSFGGLCMLPLHLVVDRRKIAKRKGKGRSGLRAQLCREVHKQSADTEKIEEGLQF